MSTKVIERILGCTVLLCSACANYATLQDPQTMPQGELELGLGGTFNSYAIEIERESTTVIDGDTVDQTREVERETFTVPALAFWGRYGISERLEAHAIGWFPLGVSVGGKYMLVGDRDVPGFVLSPGLDASMPIGVSVNDESFLRMDVYVPLHMGYRFAETFTLYLTPKYVLRVAGSQVGHSAGGTLGVAFGSDTQLLLEGGVYHDTLGHRPIVTGAVGVAFE